jgi:hypothetical protein
VFEPEFEQALHATIRSMLVIERGTPNCYVLGNGLHRTPCCRRKVNQSELFIAGRFRSAMRKWVNSMKSVRHIIIAMSLGFSLVLSLLVPFDTGIKGPVVETNPLFWCLLAITAIYAVRIRKKAGFASLAAIFFIGLSLRLMLATHTLYPEYDPWNELASVHQIQAFGFNLKGNYYHSSLPVLQLFLIALSPIFGEYNTVTFFGPIFGWVLAWIFFYKLAREFLGAEDSVLALLLYSLANILLQSYTVPETIALPIGFATVLFFYRNLAKPSIKYSFLTIAVFTLLVFTHHLATLCVIVATGTIVVVLFLKKKKNNNLLVWLSMLLMFLAYWQVYQGFLSSILFSGAAAPVNLLTFWPKPLWWWFIYLMPNLLLVLMLIAWIIPSAMKKMLPKPVEIFAATVAGGLTFALGFLIPSALSPFRILNQFSAYFFIGIIGACALLSSKRSSIMIGMLAVTMVIGLFADFPMTNMSGFYVGGYWLNHSPKEVSALQYLAANANTGSQIVIDARCSRVLDALASPGKNLTNPFNWDVFEVYNTTSTQQAWNLCIQNGFTYIFVSKFYEIIAHFPYGGATRFSDEQLSKFNAPYFTLWHENSEVSIYLVNTH